jgi:ATP-binding cassette subfamily B protein
MFGQRNLQILGAEQRRARSAGATLGRLGRYFRPYLWALLLAGVFVVAGTYMQVLIPDLTGQAVDCYLGPFGTGGGIETGDAFGNCWFTDPQPGASAAEVIRGLGVLILLIVGLYLANAVVAGLQFFLMSWAGFHLLRDLRNRVYQHLQRLSLGYFSRHEAGDVMSRFTNDVDTLQQVIGFGLVSVVQGGLLIVWVVITMLSKSWVFALVSLVTLPLMMVVTGWLSGQARLAFRRARREIGAVNADLQESIGAVREVQAFAREEENIEQFANQNAANRDANIRAQAYTSALGPSLEALGYVSLAVVAVVGGLAILTDLQLLGSAISLGLIITFIGYTQQFNRPVQQISTLWATLQNAVAGAERIFELLDEVPDLEDKPGAEALPTARGHVRFEGVEAEYNPGETVLKGIDLEALPGQTIALVGPTGAGKSTILNLLPRFYDVSAGRVTIDGHDVRDVTRKSLRSQIGVVLQDTFLFSDTVMANLRYGRPEASDAEVVDAAKLARAHDFIEKLPQGYDTGLGERGAGLSQGQRQLIAIARAAPLDPRILLLDEATSSVDTRTERQIQDALDRLLAGRTSFVVAHRLSTILGADQVLVIDGGEIVERGTHSELLALRGLYFDLYTSQFRHLEGTPGADGGAQPDAL